jgi:hypothetical protein
MNEFDKSFLEERKKYLEVKKRFEKIFDRYGKSKSQLDKNKDDFRARFNELGKFLLKSNRKVEILKKGKSSYNDKFFVGGKSGLSNRDYGGEGLDKNELIDFFLNLDKIDLKLRSELTKHYYDKWLSFVTCFESGVDKIIIPSGVVKNGSASRKYNDDMLVKSKTIKDDDGEEDDGDDDDEKVEFIDYRFVRLSEISIKSDGEEVSCYLTINGNEHSLGDFDEDIDFFFIRHYLDDILVLMGEFSKEEAILYEQQKKQYDAFMKKATPFLSLGDL